MNQAICRLGIATSIALSCLATLSPVRAQIVPDNTLPVNSTVTPGCTVCQIDGGTIQGTNLFHSFSEFGVPTGGEAYFNNDLQIQNILTRVTGNSISNIDGLLRANGTANLFLINPNGISFGENATLNLGGSFVASTASRLLFADGTVFSAKPDTSTPPLLTISVPLGLQYGTNPGRIVVQGNGRGTRTTSNLIDTNFGLRVQPNQTLALVGGDVSLEGATLKTAGGRIELGSVAGPGKVSLTPTSQGWTLGYQGVSTLRDIQMSQQATVDASGLGGGDIQVWGRRVTLTGGSNIEASTLGKQPGGTLAVNATESVELIGTSADAQSSALLAAVYPGASGKGGDLTINTGSLLVRDGAQVGDVTLGGGNGGNLTVNASQQVQLIGRSADAQFASGLLAFVYPGASGKGGNLTINTGTLLMRDGAQAGAATSGGGNGGNLTVNASQQVQLIGTSAYGSAFSGLSASANRGASGTGGDLTINTGTLLVRDGAQITAGTFGRGDGGNLTVNASQQVQLIGRSADGRSSSGLSAQANPGASGKPGDLQINTGTLLVRDGAVVTAGTFGRGNGGKLTVNASQQVQVIGTSADGRVPSSLSAQVERGASGKGGDLTINTDTLLVRDGAQVNAGTFGGGDGGKLTVNASKDVQLIGRSADGRFASGLYAQVNPGASGKGGDLTINTGTLLVRDGAQVSAGTFGGGDGGKLTINASKDVQLIGTSANGRASSGLFAQAERGASGKAGDLTINTDTLLVRDGAQVSVRSFQGQAGNMTILANSVLFNRGSLFAETAKSDAQGGANITLSGLDLLRMDNESLISAKASDQANGGNISIDTKLLVALPAVGSNGSDIIASAGQGNGGKITINADGILGIRERKAIPGNRTNDIDASSEFGSAGTVALNTLLDPSRGLNQLPEQPVDPTGQISQQCTARGENENKLTITGRGGLPQNPTELISPEMVQDDFGTVVTGTETRTDATPSPRPTKGPTQLVEAQGWIYGPDGNVILTTQAPNVTPYGTWETPVNCQVSQTSSNSVQK